MRRMTMVFAGLLLTTGCVRSLEDEFREAVPDQDDISIKVPENGGGAAAGSHELAILGERAVLYQVTRDVSRVINGGVYLILSVLRDVVRHPASEVDEDHAVWGPWTGALSPLTYRFEVRKTSDDRDYEYVLEAKPKAAGDDAYVPIVTGEAHLDGSGRSRGSFLVDGDAMHALDEWEYRGEGTAAVEYDLLEEPLTVDVSFARWTGGWHQPIDATYHYRENADLSGEFAYSADANVDETSPILESIVVTSRWITGGSGRSDASVTGGDLVGGVSVSATECWDDGFGRTYWEDSAGIVETEGDAASCPFDSAADPGR